MTSAQAILMYFDRFVPYNELPEALKKFVGEGLMDASEHRFFELLIKLYNMDQKERRTYCNKNGINLDYLIDGSIKFLERMEHLFETLEMFQKKEQTLNNYNTAIELMGTGKKALSDEMMILSFESEIAKRHKIPAAYVATLKKIIRMKRLAEENKFGEIQSADVCETSASLRYLEKLIKNKRRI